MNKHLPYRDWIFEEETLPADSAQALRRHLQGCPDCRAAAEAWKAARQSLANAGEKSPRTGFTARWKALAAERIRVPSRRPAWAMLAVSSAGSLVMALALAVQTSTQGFSLAGVFTRDLSAAAGALEDWMDTTSSLGAFLTIVSRSIPPACYLFAIFFVSLIGILWLLLFVRSTAQGKQQ
ncbi:MAG: zf-HC2 domain-containing protein [Anaerolineales bacterium]|nr:zf-HC2 domain-containing protein [Anaerolineales bacterium]